MILKDTKGVKVIWQAFTAWISAFQREKENEKKVNTGLSNQSLNSYGEKFSTLIQF